MIVVANMDLIIIYVPCAVLNYFHIWIYLILITAAWVGDVIILNSYMRKMSHRNIKKKLKGVWCLVVSKSGSQEADC